MKDGCEIRIIYTGRLFQPIKRPYYASNWRLNDFFFSLILLTPSAQKRLKLALKSILQKLAFREINSPHDFKFSKKSLGKVCLFPLYTNLESLIFPIAPGFSAIFDSHFVYKAALFVYKKYFFKMQAPPAFVHDLDSFLNTSLYPASFSFTSFRAFSPFFFCDLWDTLLPLSMDAKIKAGKLVPGDGSFILLF